MTTSFLVYDDFQQNPVNTNLLAFHIEMIMMPNKTDFIIGN